MSRALTICGNDPRLLATRKLLLEHAGLRPETVLGVGSLVSNTDGPLVLCHTLSEIEQAFVIDAVRKQRPKTPVLVIGDDHFRRESDLVFEVSAFAGAETFLAAARRLAQ